MFLLFEIFRLLLFASLQCRMWIGSVLKEDCSERSGTPLFINNILQIVKPCRSGKLALNDDKSLSVL